MPGGDRTGPWGMGPMTGRGMGFCAGNASAGYMQPGWGPGRGFGRGYGRGFGRGRGGGGWGFRNRFYAPATPAWGWGQGAWTAPLGPGPTKEEELSFLKQQSDYFQGALEDLRARMAELEGEQKKG